MRFIPSAIEIKGVGKPRVIITKPTDTYSSAATTFAATSLTIAGTVDLSAVQVGMRVHAMYVSGAIMYDCYAKITAVNDSTDVITVDAWYPTTPTNAQTAYVNGYIVDLPYCYRLSETYTPDVRVHPLYRSRVAVKHYGWKYRAMLDYSVHISADALLNAGPIMALSEGDSLLLIPHVDEPGYCYNVYHAADVSMARFGKAGGYSGFAFVFQGTENVPWPVPRSGYGFSYSAGLYGTCL